jgi:hypothetical protein
MSCITRVPLVGHRHLGLSALQARLAVLQARANVLADLVPNWIPRGNERERRKWLRQERVRTAKAIKAVKRAIAAAEGTPP